MSRVALAFAFAFALALALGACDDGPGATAEGDSATADAAADATGAPDGGSVAVNPNAPTDCVIGTLACACGEGAGCALSPDGDPLTCTAGVCLLPTCPRGKLGCECRAGACDDADAACQDGMCARTGCAPGSSGCACASGSCDVGLFCKDAAVCVDSAGYEGGKCLANGTCHAGNRCDQGQGRCVYCDRGTQGCACTTAGTCATGLTCAAGLCTAASDLPPSDPACHTPCRQDLQSVSGTRVCDADGLLAGCIDDQVCTDGSCLVPGEAKPTCASDVDCPFFQACLGGACYSNCESNLDCPSGRGCHKKVCRVPCMLGTGGSSCPSAETCDSRDGETGFCMPITAPVSGPMSLPTGTTVTVTTHGLSALSNLDGEGTIRVALDTPGTQRITIRKVSHELYDSHGAREVIDAPVDEATGLSLPCEGSATDCPLWWLELSDGTTTTRGQELEITCQGTCPDVTVRNAGGSPGVRYDGRLVVTSVGGEQEVAVRYVEDVAGRWEGQVHYFTVFNDEGVDDWRLRADKSDVEDVKNALIQRWGAFRRGNVEGGWGEFEAVLTATRTGSWDQPRVKELCKAVTGGSTTAACYPYTNPAGVRTYVDNIGSAPIPSTTTELPFAINVRAGADGQTIYTGRIDSGTALHYPGNPSVSLGLAADPARPGACDPRVASACVVNVTSFTANLTVGGRYAPTSFNCVPGYQTHTTPWLVPGFEVGTSVDPTLGRVRTECRDTQVPRQPVEDIDKALNMDLAGANPSPDGEARRRDIELLDGALVDQTTLFLLVRERFASFVPGQEPVSAYAFITLKRTPVELADEDYVGSPARDPQATARRFDFPSCDPDLLDALPDGIEDDESALVNVLIEGSSAAAAAYQLDPIPAAEVENRIHYLCDGYFDGGGAMEELSVDPFDGGVPDTGGYVSRDGGGAILVQIPVACLPGSEVTFFATASGKSQLDVLQDDCQNDGSCRARLDEWLSSDIASQDITWRCLDPARVLCDVTPGDLRDGKAFFRLRETAASTKPPIPPLAAAIDQAFRYKTRFQSSLLDDTEVGFAPSVCVPGSDARPYCYDPAAIEQIRQRIDCLVGTYTDDIGKLDPAATNALERYLRGNFAQSQGHDGFERLYAELLVMLGDEELTGAFASRFDLAGVATRNFDGEHFEIDGINLTGVAGAEMQRLYTAVQYYEMALERLYRFGPNIAAALGRGNTSTQADMISPDTVTLYLGRLVRASAQESFAWSEIAKRYKSFNRPEIARRVVERAYARTYLESVMLARLMLDISVNSGASYQDQIVAALETAQRTFRVALLDMRDVFDDIVKGTTYFGYPPEYVPFPAIDTSTTNFGSNGFDALLSTARQRLATAKEREQIALDSLTSGRVDTTQFQSELVRVRNNYEDQLATICGQFTGEDGATYPAIRRYAEKSKLASVMGDPCGYFANGTLYEQMLEVDGASTALEGVLTRYRNTNAEIEDERTRVASQCDLVRAQATFEYEQGEAVRDAQRDQSITQAAITGGVKLLTVAKDAVTSFETCTTAFDPPSKAVCAGFAGVSGGLGLLAAAGESTAEAIAIGFQYDIATKHLETGKWVTQKQCEVQLIDSAAKMQSLIRSLDETTLEALRAQIQLELQVAQVTRTYNEAQRLQERAQEAIQQLIDVEAARNDPNVRIYRNDAVINADIAFNDAMRAAYRATRMYEYYTSTSYAHLDELFLIRLAARGRPNLENYLTDLENAFQDFEEELGLPDPRVAILSLRDDILKIPYLDADEQPISQSDRIAMMQAALEDPGRLDRNGYIVIPFGTSVSELSPLTRNHKIRYVEANVIGSEVGDRLGRIYLRQRGTSVLQTVDDRVDYYVFPQRTAVVDVFFNGNRVFPPEVYQNLRLRDRPYAQTMWELVINRRDEAVNRDIDLESLSDIQILIHYTDFTVF
ncbi:MAG: hypothetical protein H6745_04160 [Deltaproteobacteria bacterium]|nr:hypothetical protein [Deltaproteobacteria bacterium]